MESEDDARTFVNRSFFKTKTYKYLTIYGKLFLYLSRLASPIWVGWAIHIGKDVT